MGSPTGISSEGRNPAPPARLDDSAISGVAAVGAPTSTTRLWLGAGPGLQTKARTSNSKTENETKTTRLVN